jgi:transposase-like protein
MKKKKNIYLSDDTKRKIVSEVLSGKFTKEEARRFYGIKNKSAILGWMRIFAGGSGREANLDPIPLLKDMSEHSDNTAKLEARIEQLEEELEISKLKGKAYQIMVEIAKEDYGINLEKKRGAKQLRGLKK